MAFPPVTLTNPAANLLQQHLAKRFSVRKRRSKHAGSVPPFQLDDRNDRDTWKWEASVGVEDRFPPSLFLILHSIPQEPFLVKFVQNLKGRVVPRGEHATFVIHLRPDNIFLIRELAGKIRSVTTDKWQWLTERAADALFRLADQLGHFPIALHR